MLGRGYFEQSDGIMYLSYSTHTMADRTYDIVGCEAVGLRVFSLFALIRNEGCFKVAAARP